MVKILITSIRNLIEKKLTKTTREKIQGLEKVESVLEPNTSVPLNISWIVLRIKGNPIRLKSETLALLRLHTRYQKKLA